MGVRAVTTDVPASISRLAPDQLAILAHELRTPLATMHATLELLADLDSLSPEDAVGLLNRLGRGLSWLETLVENLGTWPAVVNGHLPLQRSPIFLRDCIDAAQSLVSPFLERRHQELEVIASSPGPRICGDPHRICQVLVNLLSNASAYSPWDDVIELTVSTDDGWAHVRISDHGPGVSAEEQERIFMRFARGAAGDRRPGGLGLGLHIVKALVELHGGRVGVESTLGEGASFWFSLPRLADPPPDAAAPAQPSARQHLARSQKNGRTHEGSARR